VASSLLIFYNIFISLLSKFPEKTIVIKKKVTVQLACLILHLTASHGVAVLQMDIGIDSNQTCGINEIKYRRCQQVIE